MSKNLNLKVSESLFYEFHRVKANLKAGTNQDALMKMVVIAEKALRELKSKKEKDEFLRTLIEEETEILEIQN
ncbi:MAG: hypothetical protein ACTSRE_08600 [Promethearchaeota archaeon]